MAEKSWNEKVIDDFFANRSSATRSQCDQRALDISGGVAARQVDVPGSLSYTVICTTVQTQEQQDEDAIVVSFRQIASGLDKRIVDLAKATHGCLVPETTNYCIMSSSDPPLGIYTMPLLPGVACLEALSYRAEMDPDEETRHICFITHLARYFARCWSSPQPVEAHTRAEIQAGISHKLMILKKSPIAVVPISILSELENILPMLFTDEYPQVLTHGDFSKTNILVNPDTYEVTGIVDWSIATVQPFGMELDCLFLMTGCMDLNGWHDYACRPRLWAAFWAEFWTASGIEDDASRRANIRTTAEAAAKIGAIVRYAFDRTAEGRLSEVFSTSKSMLGMLAACFEE